MPSGDAAMRDPSEAGGAIACASPSSSQEFHVAAIVASTDINRSPDEVFAYAVDPANLPTRQKNVVSATREGPLGLGALEG